MTRERRVPAKIPSASTAAIRRNSFAGADGLRQGDGGELLQTRSDISADVGPVGRTSSRDDGALRSKRWRS